MNKAVWAWIGVAVVAAAAVGAGYYVFVNDAAVRSGGNAAVNGGGASGSAPSSTTAQPLSAPVAVPAQNATTVPPGVAAPTLVAPGSPSGATSFRSFNVTVTAQAFSPSTIIVNQGDTVHINITASGGAYDFTQQDLGLMLKVPAGETKVVQFDATSPGKFTFYCTSCGGPSKGPVGYVEVVAKK